MVRIEPGSFLMGSPASENGRDEDETEHQVTLTRPYLMGVYEVSQELYQEVTGETPFVPEFQGVSLLGPRLPAQGMTWREATEFANTLSQRHGFEPVYLYVDKEVYWYPRASGYRLPTEAEWEYAARAGSRDAYAGTDSLVEVCQYANVLDEQGAQTFQKAPFFPCNDGRAGASEIGAFAPNAWGLHDMTGNVWEWVWDRYQPFSAAAVTDPWGPDTGTDRVDRSGSWGKDPNGSRIGNRGSWHPDTRSMYLGIRLVRSL